MPFTFSHDTKSTVKLKITITTKFKSNRSSTGYIKEAGRWKTPTFPCDFFHKITSLPPAMKLGQGYVFTGVCDSVHRGEYLTRYTPLPGTRYTPESRYTPPGTRYTPLGPGTPPGTRYTPQDQVQPPGTRYTPGTRCCPPPRTRCPPPGPGTPPRAQHTGRYGLCAGGTHPTGMQSCNLLLIQVLLIV